MERNAAAPRSIGDLPARRGVHPGRRQELLAGADEVGGAGADPLGVAREQPAPGGHVVEQELHPGRDDRRERLHALDGDAVGELAEYVGQARVIGGQLLGPVPHGRGEQQLAARRYPQLVDGLQAPLVGHPELADLLHLVAEELDPQRVLLGGREHVDDAAAHRHLTSALHQVGAHVADLDQAGDHLIEAEGLAWPQRHRRDVAEPADDRLQQATDRGHHHTERAGPGTGRVGVREPAQDREPAAAGVRAGRDPLVRQGLPGGEVGHAVARQQ